MDTRGRTQQAHPLPSGANITYPPMPTKQPRLALVINELSKARIQHLAEKHGRSVSGEIVAAVDDWVERHPDLMADFASDFEPTEEEQAEIDQMLKDAQRRAYEAVMLKRRTQ